MNFGDIKTEVTSWLIDAPSGQSTRIGAWVQQAIKDAEKRYNFQYMRDEESATTVDNQRELVAAKPARWKESRGLPYLIWQGGSVTEIDWMPSRSDAVRTYGQDAPAEGSAEPIDEGKPRYLLERPDSIDVFPFPDLLSLWDDGNYRVRIPYWRYSVDLVADGDTNWLTDNADYYIIWKAVSIGQAWARDEDRSEFYNGKAEKEFVKARRLDKLSRLPDRINMPVSPDAYAGRSRLGLRG